MDLIVERVEVWAAPIDDQPGSLATTRSACGRPAPISTSSWPGGRRRHPARRWCSSLRCTAMPNSKPHRSRRVAGRDFGVCRSGKHPPTRRRLVKPRTRASSRFRVSRRPRALAGPAGGELLSRSFSSHRLGLQAKEGMTDEVNSKRLGAAALEAGAAFPSIAVGAGAARGERDGPDTSAVPPSKGYARGGDRLCLAFIRAIPTAAQHRSARVKSGSGPVAATPPGRTLPPRIPASQPA